MEKPQKIKKAVTLTGLGIIAALFVLCYIKFGSSLLAFVSDPERLEAWLEKYRGMGAPVFVGIRAFQTVIKLFPAEPLEIAAGYIYGSIGGMLLCMAGSFLGSLVIIALVKLFGARLINATVSESTLRKFSLCGREERAMPWLFIVYLIPSTPKDIITYIAALSDISMVKFMAVTTVARIPSIITSTLCGEQLGEKNYAMAAAVFAATLALGIVGTAIYNKSEKKKKSAPQAQKKARDMPRGTGENMSRRAGALLLR